MKNITKIEILVCGILHKKINFLIVGHPIELYYVSKIKHWTEAIFIHLKLCGWLRQFEM